VSATFRIHVGDGYEFQPRTITQYKTRRSSGNIVHPILGRKFPDVTLRPGGARTGTIELRVPVDAEGWGRKGSWAEDLLTRGEVCSITNTLPRFGLGDEVTMFFVVTGDIGKELDSTRTEWVMTFDFQEIETPDRVYITSPGMDPLPEDAA
jgi:hypothetical protein